MVTFDTVIGNPPSSSEPSKPVVDDEDEETQDEVDLSMIDGLDRKIKDNG